MLNPCLSADEVDPTAPDVDATIYLTVDDRMRVIESLAPVP